MSQIIEPSDGPNPSDQPPKRKLWHIIFAIALNMLILTSILIQTAYTIWMFLGH